MESMLVMEGGSRTFGEVEDAYSVLLNILNLYWEGLTTPLRFFPESSMAYAYKMEWNVERAEKKWQTGYDDSSGEGDNPYFQLCFGEVDPFNKDFERVSRVIFEPLLQNLVED
jgi:exodeoxyribonuclease V gamma subunit